MRDAQEYLCLNNDLPRQQAPFTSPGMEFFDFHSDSLFSKSSQQCLGFIWNDQVTSKHNQDCAVLAKGTIIDDWWNHKTKQFFPLKCNCCC